MRERETGRSVAGVAGDARAEVKAKQEEQEA